MRFDGKRASEYTQQDLYRMLVRRKGPDGKALNGKELRELRRTYELRRPGRRNLGDSMPNKK